MASFNPMRDSYSLGRRVVSSFRAIFLPKQTTSDEIQREQEIPFLEEQLKYYQGNYVRRFTPLTDNLTGETVEMRYAYRRAVAEPTVKAALIGKIGQVASLDLRCVPENPDDSAEKQVAEFCQQRLLAFSGCGLPKPGVSGSGTAWELVWPILSGGLIDGFSVSEKLYGYVERGKYKGKWTIRGIKPKDTRFIQFLVDPYRNITGIYSLTGNSGRTFEPNDFINWAYLPFFASPTGMSDLRAVYRCIETIIAALKLRMLFLDTLTGPYIVGKYKDPAFRQRLEQALSNARGRGWISIQSEMDVEVLDLAAKGTSDFQAAIDDMRKEVAIGITGAFLQMLEGTAPEQRGDSSVHKTQSEIFVWLLAVLVQGVVNEQIIPDLVDPNFGPQVAYPRCVLGAVDPAEQLKELQVGQAILGMGLDLSKKDVYHRTGWVPPMDEGDTLKGQSPQQPPGGPPGVGGMPGLGGPPAPGGPAAPMPTDQPTQEFAEDKPPDSKGPPPNGNPSAAGDVALPGREGQRVRQLLAESQRRGTQVLQDITRQALERQGSKILSASTLFNPEESEKFADALAASMATADLLGRTRIREQAAHAERGAAVQAFAEAVGRTANPPDQEPIYEAFAEDSIEPLAPEAAVNYFKSLVPTLGVNPHIFGPWMDRRAFTVAGISEISLLDAIKEIIRDRIETGGTPNFTTDDIQGILNDAGVSTSNPDRACFLPGTLVEGDILAASKASYSGPAVEIETNDGRRLRVTVNHPILTPAGWKCAGDVQEGDDLVCYGDPIESLSNLRAVGDVFEFSHSTAADACNAIGTRSLETRPSQRRTVDDQQIPASVEDVFETLLVESHSGLHVQGPCAPLDFHGDATFFQGEIDIVAADRMLIEGLDAERFELFDQVDFMLRNVTPAHTTSPCSGSFESLGIGSFSSTNSGTCLLDAPSDAVSFGDWVESRPCRSHRIGLSANLDPSLFHATAKSAGGDVQLYRNIAVAFPRLVSTNRVSKIKRITWVGHVYDLQTRTGFIVSEGIISSNSMIFRTNAMDALTKGMDDERQADDMAEHFPVWRYLGIEDGRQGADHQPHFNRYYPNSASFAEVRGKRPFNCRCVPQAIGKREWSRRQAQGARVEPWPPVRTFAETREVVAARDSDQPVEFSTFTELPPVNDEYYGLNAYLRKYPGKAELTDDDLQDAMKERQAQQFAERRFTEQEIADFADRSHLVRKVITNKAGRKQTVWVKPTQDEAKPRQPAKPEEEQPKPPAPHTVPPAQVKAELTPDVPTIMQNMPGGQEQQPVKPEKPTVDSVHAHIQSMQAKPALDSADITALAEHIQNLTVKQIGELKQRLGIKASGAKAAMAKKIAESAVKAKADAQASAEPGGKHAGIYDRIGKIDLARLTPDTADAAKQIVAEASKSMNAAEFREFAKKTGLNPAAGGCPAAVT